MFRGLGIGWASTLLGFVAAALVPVPIWFYLNGSKLRAKSKFAAMYTPKEPEDTNTEEEVSPGSPARTETNDRTVEKEQ